MTESRAGFIGMAAVAAALVVLGGLRATGATPALLASLAAGLAAALGLVAARMRQTQGERSAFAALALVNGFLCIAGAIAPFVVPALAGVAYQPQSDWLSAVDLTPPAIRWLRIAVASGCFALALLVAGLGFLAAAYFLLRRGGGRRHAH